MFKLSENIDPNKVFIVNRSELIGKLSPNIYANNFHFKSKIYPLFKLADLAFINPTTTFSNIQQQEDITFIPMEAVNQNLGIIDVEYTKKIEETKGYTKFKENDLIWAKITPCMQNGKSAIVRNTINGYACGSTEFFIIRCKTNTILIEYIHFILRDKRILKTAMNFFGGSAGQQRVSKDFLLNLLIPLPPLEIQQQIVDLYKKAYTEKQQKEAEAQRLLDSIDNYLLGELGITLPKEEEHLLQNTDKNNSYNLDNDNPLVKKGRLFLTNLSEVTGKRIDTDYNSKYFYCLFQSLNNSIYPFERIKKYLKAIKTGTTPNQKLNAFTTEKEIPFLRNTNLKKYEINIENTKYIRTKYKDFLTFSYKDEVIMCIAGTIGISSVNIYDIPISINQNVSSLRFSEEINPFFISYWFNTNIFLSLAKRASSVATILYLNNDNLKSLPIPIPPLQKQNEIATHISQIRNKANTLKQEGKGILEQAKQEVEQMILGN